MANEESMAQPPEPDVSPEDEEEAHAEVPHDEPLLTLEAAVAKVPADLKQQMQDLLKAEFREVWPR